MHINEGQGRVLSDVREHSLALALTLPAGPPPLSASYHAYLLLSKTAAATAVVGGGVPAAATAASRGTTMVLKTGEELEEVTQG